MSTPTSFSSSRDVIRGSATRTLVGATLGFFVGFAAVSLFGPTAKLLKGSMGLTAVQAGLLVATPSATGSLLRIPFGAWVDTTGGRRPFLVLLLLSEVGLLGLLALLAAHPEGLTAAHYPLLLGLGMFAGCGIAVFSVGIGQVSYWYPQDRQGRALATYAGLGNVAPGLFALLLPLVLGKYGITGAYGVWCGLLLAGIVAYAMLAGNAPFFQLWRRGRGRSRAEAESLARQAGQALFPSGGVRAGLAATARLPETWALVALYFTSFGGFLALTAWLPTYWGDRFGVDLTTAGALTMSCSVLASVIRVPGGFASDRFGGECTAAGSFVVMAAGGVVAAAASGLTVAVVGCVIMAVGMGVANAAVFKMVPAYLAAAGGGAGAGWVGGLGAFGGFALPPILGALVQRYGQSAGYAAGFVVFGGLALVSLGLTVALARRRPAAASETS